MEIVIILAKYSELETEMKPYTSESITHLLDANERLRAREYLSQCNQTILARG